MLWDGEGASFPLRATTSSLNKDPGKDQQAFSPWVWELSLLQLIFAKPAGGGQRVLLLFLVLICSFTDSMAPAPAPAVLGAGRHMNKWGAVCPGRDWCRGRRRAQKGTSWHHVRTLGWHSVETHRLLLTVFPGVFTLPLAPAGSASFCPAGGSLSCPRGRPYSASLFFSLEVSAAGGILRKPSTAQDFGHILLFSPGTFSLFKCLIPARIYFNVWYEEQISFFSPDD